MIIVSVDQGHSNTVTALTTDNQFPQELHGPANIHPGDECDKQAVDTFNLEVYLSQLCYPSASLTSENDVRFQQFCNTAQYCTVLMTLLSGKSSFFTVT